VTQGQDGRFQLIQSIATQSCPVADITIPVPLIDLHQRQVQIADAVQDAKQGRLAGEIALQGGNYRTVRL
jgi:hypothetical protein